VSFTDKYLWTNNRPSRNWHRDKSCQLYLPGHSRCPRYTEGLLLVGSSKACTVTRLMSNVGNRYVWFGDHTDNDNVVDCWNLAQVHDIPPEVCSDPFLNCTNQSNSSKELILWNPSLSQKELTSASLMATAASLTAKNPYAYPCTLSMSSSYCVALTSTTPSKYIRLNTPHNEY
jgi:hypothetical protein